MRSFQRADKTTWSAFARFLTCYRQVQDSPCLYFQPSTSPRFSITDRQNESRCLPLAEILESKNYPLGQFPLDKSGTPSYQLFSRRFKVSCSVQSFWSRQFMSFSIKNQIFHRIENPIFRCRKYFRYNASMDLLSHLNETVPPRQASFCPEHSNMGVGITLCNAERNRNDIIQRPFANPSPTTSENSAQQAQSTKD
jgi:hypothetical protein